MNNNALRLKNSGFQRLGYITVIKVLKSNRAQGLKKEPDELNPSDNILPNKIRFEVWGEELIQKRVKISASSGRVYLPTRWVGRKVKIIRID